MKGVSYGFPWWCERGELNPQGFPHWILSPARLPIPPLSHCSPAQYLAPASFQPDSQDTEEKLSLQEP